MKARIWTVPNQITFLRLGFLPVFLMLIAYDRYRWALLVLVVSGLSDGFDGLLARSLNQRSALGAYLDPIADKLLLSSSFVLLAFKKQLAWWLTILVLSRDVLILIVAVVILLVSGYRPFPPSIYGKLTTGVPRGPGSGLSELSRGRSDPSAYLRGHGFERRIRFPLFVHYCPVPAWCHS